MKRGNNFLKIVCAIAAFIIMSESALADSWLSPQTKQFYSDNKQYYFKVVPQEAAHARMKKQPRGTLFRLDADGIYRSAWTIRLDNEVSPVTALVSDDGDYVVTFDNWYRKGFGDNVIVIYGENGRLIKKYGLEDILSPQELEAIPRSVSSRHWGEDHRLDETNKQLILKIVTNREMPYGDEAEFRELKIDLATGSVVGE